MNLKIVSVTFDDDESVVPLDVQPYIMIMASPFLPCTWRWKVFYSHGCQAGSIRHKLSGLVAAAIRVVTLVSPPSYWARFCNLVVIAVTAPFTSVINSSLSMSVGGLLRGRECVSSCFFLCQAIISSRSTALNTLCTLKWGSAKHRAADTIAAVITPFTPTGVTNSAMFGVSRKGTGRLASSSPWM